MSKGSWRRPAAIPRSEVEARFEAVFPSRKAPAGSIKRPPCLPPRESGGVRCDSIKGPCACGAWHELSELTDAERDVLKANGYYSSIS